MKKDDLISIIVPVYNVSNYLRRCIDSLINQSYKELEIFLVDDGSTDNSGTICDSYSKKDSRIVVIHKENGGLSDARNAALLKINGKYLTFIDSDDYISDNYIAILYSLIIKNNADMSICNHLATIKDNEKLILGNKVEIYNSKEALCELLYQNKFTTSAWAKMYKSDLFHGITFPKGKIFEDVSTIYKVIDRSQKIVYNNSKLYFYFLRPQSIVHSNFNMKKMDYIYNTTELYDFVEMNYPELIKAARFRFLWSNIHIWVNIPDRKKYNNIYKVINNNIIKYRMGTLLDVNIKIKTKIIIFTSFFGWTIMKHIYNLKSKIQ